ncbi:HEAT repeat domain-containing protein (plasmid) [Streptomyces yangpuensis]|uniref:HEAT repeat domain-containing protein n=1 Tax=Streptomyces yangpuensis TaxID=1648182 RepID=A0ABY5Q8W9_9ACTN|nr:HEAT repeat domain-containing protein [Streptomyces yangpuensis]UUY52674.1 HEAT repeat domain-containing protein [Streptomyces yangpuensis]
MDVKDAGGSAGDGAEPPLVAAVRAGDTFLVKCLLEADKNYDEVSEAFGVAVRAFRGDLAELLLLGGADAGRCAPHELPSLREAVDFGSPALVEALLNHSLRDRYPASELREMRDLARSWYEAGTEAELRRRTGSQDETVRTRVQDDSHHTVGELTLGARTVRDGHGAILTDLEELLGIRATFEELTARALDHDPDHTAWSRATILLSHRRDPQTWTAVTALRTHPDPSHRLLGAELMRLTELFSDDPEDELAAHAVAALTAWSAGETDTTVLAELLHGLHSYAGPRAEAALLAHAGHPDAGVRQAVAGGLGTRGKPAHLSGEARDTLLTLLADDDTDVRIAACHSAGETARPHAVKGDPALADAMAALLHDPLRRVRLVAVYGLALHEDERCVEAADRLGPPRPGFRAEEMACLDVAWRYQWRRDEVTSA